MRFFLFNIVYALSIASYAQDNGNNKRMPFKLTLAVDADTFYETEVKESYYLNGPDILQLYPGEKVFLQVQQEKGKIKDIKIANGNTKPFETIEILFKQDVHGKEHKAMVLQINNPFNMSLVYEAKIFLRKENKWVKTSVLPVQANLSSFETWPDMIITIALSGWKFIE